MDDDTGITVREGTTADLARARRVRLDTFEFHRRQAVPQYFRATDEPFLMPARVAFVDSLGVIEQWRGKGAGRALMQAAEAWARHNGAERLHLNVWEFNDDAIAFYERLGYQAFSRNMWRKL